MDKDTITVSYSNIEKIVQGYQGREGEVIPRLEGILHSYRVMYSFVTKATVVFAAAGVCALGNTITSDDIELTQYVLGFLSIASFPFSALNYISRESVVASEILLERLAEQQRARIRSLRS